MENTNPTIIINDVPHQRSEMDTDLERDVFDAIMQTRLEERGLNIKLLGIQFQREGMCNTLIGLRNGGVTEEAESKAEAEAEDLAHEEID